MIAYRCEDSPECIFTAIYRAYEEKCDPRDTRICLTEDPLLFAEDRPVTVEEEKAEKVLRTLRRRFGEEDLQSLCLCLASPSEDKGQAAYRTIAKGLGRGCRPGHLFDDLADPDVHKAFALARGAGNELHHLYGFLRFQELEGGILYARIGPKNDLTAFLMPHFADRFPEENFLIQDEPRGLCGVHPVGKEWFLVQSGQIFLRAGAEGESIEERGTAPLRQTRERLMFSAGEEEIQELFRCFCRTIAIEERWNLELQRNLLPLRFRGYMTEF